jgi:uncharacterized protein (TIGR03435 family)
MQVANTIDFINGGICGMLKPMHWKAAVILICLVVAAEAQSAFSVASLKPSARIAGRDARGSFAFAPDRVSARNVSLKDLILQAYDLMPYQIAGGPGWLDSDEFDLDARSETPANREELRRMLQNLLAERFHLTLRTEEKEIRAYVLSVDKAGAKIHAVSAETPPAPSAPGRRPFHGDLDQFARLLSIQLSIPTSNDPTRPSMAAGPGVPVVNNTGLPGVYDFSVEFRPEAGVDMFLLWQRILQEQLGLKLESRRIQAKLYTVERAERIPAAN